MTFTQTIAVKADSADQLTELLDSWDRDQKGTAPGYEGARLLADVDDPGRYLIEVDFSSSSQAQENNGRSETAAWAEKLQAVARTDPDYRNFEVAYKTG